MRSRLAVILDIKELATPSFSGCSHSVAHIPASDVKMRRDGMRRCCQISLDAQDADFDVINSTTLMVGCQGVMDAIQTL